MCSAAVWKWTIQLNMKCLPEFERLWKTADVSEIFCARKHENDMKIAGKCKLWTWHKSSTCGRITWASKFYSFFIDNQLRRYFIYILGEVRFCTGNLWAWPGYVTSIPEPFTAGHDGGNHTLQVGTSGRTAHCPKAVLWAGGFIYLYDYEEGRGRELGKSQEIGINWQ